MDYMCQEPPLCETDFLHYTVALLSCHPITLLQLIHASKLIILQPFVIFPYREFHGFTSIYSQTSCHIIVYYNIFYSAI